MNLVFFVNDKDVEYTYADPDFSKHIISALEGSIVVLAGQEYTCTTICFDFDRNIVKAYLVSGGG